MRSWETIEDFIPDLPGLNTGGREIDDVIMHHTYDPDHATWAGDATADGILSYWKQQTTALGYTHPLGAHFIVSPSGKIYAPFEDVSPQLSSNSDQHANEVGVSIEVVGNFDTGHDTFEGDQAHAALGLFGALMNQYDIGADNFYFHRSFPAAGKTCPGSSLNLDDIKAKLPAAQAWAKTQ
jgi:N-acetylmuramoyl-L-alanine amidase-like protein